MMVADLPTGCDDSRTMKIDERLLRQCWFLAGPTAVGKTALSLELADRIGAEIVSLDSMSIYREMNVGTAKPDIAARTRVPHHLVDIVEPHEEFSLADYVRSAGEVCRNIVSRGRIPLFVGGTGLYLRGMLRGVFEGPPANTAIRQRWQEFAEREGGAALRSHLESVDPGLAARLHPNDVRRMIRGLEVHELTGVPLSVQQQERPLPPEMRPLHVDWLEPPRDWLYERINRRVLEMFEEELVAEVSRLLAADRPLSHTARQALGYREVIDHLEQGVPLEETIALIQTRTRQFAKRQHTWFRNLEECRAIPITGGESAAELAGRLMAATGNRTA